MEPSFSEDPAKTPQSNSVDCSGPL